MPGDVIWMPIPSTQGEYLASSDGQIRKATAVRGKLPRTLSVDINSTGYERVAICIGGICAKRFVHRLVCEAFSGPAPSEDHVVGHIDGNPLNNRRENLRWATASENSGNTRRAGNGAGYRGVVKRRGGFAAYGCIGSKTVFLGAFDTAREAARAYDEHAVQHFGAFAKLNFPSQRQRVGDNHAPA